MCIAANIILTIVGIILPPLIYVGLVLVFVAFLTSLVVAGFEIRMIVEIYYFADISKDDILLIALQTGKQISRLFQFIPNKV